MTSGNRERITAERPNRPPGQTPSQTVGPYYHLGLLPESVGFDGVAGADLAIHSDPSAQIITVSGRLLDGNGIGISDGLIEVWQADPEGRYGTAGFPGFGRVQTDPNGNFRFRTVKPGAVSDGQNRMQAPHLNLTVFARGLLNHAFTRCYFPDETLNDNDPVLELVPVARRSTLIAQKMPGHYSFDIHLQGEVETVFFDF